MAKLIQFPLEMADGAKVRTIEELREHADVASIAANYENGKLYRWLKANYLDDEAENIDSLQKLIKDENDKISRVKIQKLYDALGIAVDETQFAEYLSNNVATETNESGTSCSIEDDESLKSEMKKVLPESFNLSEWKVCQNSESDEKTTVEIENESLGIYTAVTLKKDDEFFKRIATLVYRTNEAFAKKTPEIPEPSSVDVSFVKEEIKNIAERTKGEIVKFGKHEWRVIDFWDDYAFLLCTKPVATKMYDEVENYLLTDFFENDFSPAEKKQISKSEDYTRRLAWSIHDDRKVFLLPLYIAKGLSLQEKQQSVDWWVSGGWIKSTGGYKTALTNIAKGVIPAIIVKTR